VWKRIGIVVGTGLALLLGVGVVVGWSIHSPRPDGVAGPEADQLAHRMEAAVGIAQWTDTGYVTWNFGGRQQHAWDRRRSLSRVRWGTVEVLFDIGSDHGVAFRDGEPVAGTEVASLVARARSRWINDSFWLNPVAKLFDPGTQRRLVTRTGESPGLLVIYGQGGDTPGDAYLWQLDASGRPTAWRMWVQIIPIGGLAATWEGWQTLPTGAQVSTEHRIGPWTLKLSDVRAARHWSDLETSDPFAALLP
jgi:hypothetical protein